jgi:hypothetical protein
VSLIFHVTDATPLASVVDVVALNEPLPAGTTQLTVTLAAGCPPSATRTDVASEVPIGAVRSRKTESAERLYGVVLCGPLGPVVPETWSDEHAAAKTKRARGKNRRIGK